MSDHRARLLAKNEFSAKTRANFRRCPAGRSRACLNPSSLAMTGGYGQVDILHSCTISVDPGEIAVIVGPNGAGKSTAMKAVFGMLKLRGGHVR
jgi:ABC-type uncharacterized transport system ATPase subunit